MAENTIKTRFQVRRDTESNFQGFTLAEGEPSYATDTRVFKIGDGILPWEKLPTITLSFIGETQSTYDAKTGITAYITEITFEEVDANIDNLKLSGKSIDTIPLYSVEEGETLTLHSEETKKDLIDLTGSGTYKRLKAINVPNIEINDEGHKHEYLPKGDIK